MSACRTLAFFLATAAAACLAGCDHSDRTIIERSQRNGQWMIDSRVRVAGAMATFECRHSASGRCHYTLFGACRGAANTECGGTVLKHFSIAVGGHLALDAPPGFDACVRIDATPSGRDCRPLPSG